MPRDSFTSGRANRVWPFAGLEDKAGTFSVFVRVSRSQRGFLHSRSSCWQTKEARHYAVISRFLWWPTAVQGFLAGKYVRVSVLLDSAQVEYRDPSTFFGRSVLRWVATLCQRVDPEVYRVVTPSLIQLEQSFHRFQAILRFTSHRCSPTVFPLCKKFDRFRVQRYVNNKFFVDEYAPLWCTFKWCISWLDFYTRDWRIQCTVRSFFLNAVNDNELRVTYSWNKDETIILNNLTNT